MQVRNLGAPVELAGRYFSEGADEVTFLNITGFRDFPLGDLPMLEVWLLCCAAACFTCCSVCCALLTHQGAVGRVGHNIQQAPG